MPVDDYGIEEELLRAFQAYLLDCGIADVRDSYDYIDIEAGENPIGFFFGMADSDPDLPQHDIRMDASGFFSTIVTFKLVNYAPDDRDQVQFKADIKTFREAIYREDMMGSLNDDPLSTMTYKGILTGPSNKLQDGKFREWTMSLTLKFVASK